MKITRSNAMKLWTQHFGDAEYAEDFHGYLMCKYGYGDDDYFIWYRGEKIYCGWNIHHIMPKALGGTNATSNLLCTNIATNYAAENKSTYWIDDSKYQVQRIPGTKEYDIIKLY